MEDLQQLPNLKMEQQSQIFARQSIKRLVEVSSFGMNVLGSSNKIFRGCFIPDGKLHFTPFENSSLFCNKPDGSDSHSIELE